MSDGLTLSKITYIEKQTKQKLNEYPLLSAMMKISMSLKINNRKLENELAIRQHTPEQPMGQIRNEREIRKYLDTQENKNTTYKIYGM